MPKIISPISLGSNSIYAVEDILVKGGYKIVEDITERDSIPEVLLKEGCPVYVKSEETTYRYSNNGNWVKELSFNGKEIQSKEAPFLISKVDENGKRRSTLILGEEYTDSEGNKSYQAGIQAEAFDLKAYEINEDGSKTTKAGLRITKEGKVLFRGILCDENGVPLVDLFQNKEIVVVDIYEIIQNQDVDTFLELSDRALKGEISIFVRIGTSIGAVQGINKQSDTEAHWGLVIVSHWDGMGGSTLSVYGIVCRDDSITVSEGYHPLPKAELPNPSTENYGKVIGITENGYVAVDVTSGGGGGESCDCAYTEEEQAKLNNAVLKLDNHEERIQTLEENGGGVSGGFIPTDSPTIIYAKILGSEEYPQTVDLREWTHTLIDWGDGTINAENSHSYTTEGEYTIKVYGNTYIGAINPDEYNEQSTVQRVYISDNVLEIGAYAFNGQGSLKHIEIGKSVRKIGKRAFGSLLSYHTIIIHSNKMIDCHPNMYGDEENEYLEKIVVPYNLLEEYKELFKGTWISPYLDSIAYVSDIKDESKYSLKYLHYIHLTEKTNGKITAYINFQIISNFDVEMTYNNICLWLDGQGFNDNVAEGNIAQLPVSGAIMWGDTLEPILGLVCKNKNILWAYTASSTGISLYQIVSLTTTIIDKVIQIIDRDL